MDFDNKTLNYYNKYADSFAAGTADVDFRENQDKFLELLGPDACILDFGCGSGRDTKYFLSRGYRVDAVDGSEKLCRIAGKLSGIKVRQMLFQELDAVNQYDGIWACASILHLPGRELETVLEKIAVALKKNGILYISFKYGEFEGERSGRYFKDFTAESFSRFMQNIRNLKIEETWITGDVRVERGNEKWLNLILRKIEI